ncbi:Universal stress protein UP12 [Vibrio stylophorae]|uniref:Universal stress protein n=1 Tax=Vibrio stylophorae TaxID=659351 RepID=A0ABM8ZQK0_9VIBR|nr:universal stress protein [Vibrio stylophorae]CAH0532552.1 Universal stress protein UP12 [Vibrio stylophorae]
MYQQILIPVDLNENKLSDKALKHAIWLAQHCHATLHLLNVVPGIHQSMVATYFPKDAAQAMKHAAQQQLEQFAAQHIPAPITYTTTIKEGKPYTTIIEHAQHLNADLIVLPSHKRSKVDKVMLGSVATKVAAHSPIHIMVIKP